MIKILIDDMQRRMSMDNQKRVLGIIGSIVFLVVGVFFVPRLLKKYTGKFYKKNHKDINFEDFGPEIVKKHTEEVEESGN